MTFHCAEWVFSSWQLSNETQWMLLLTKDRWNSCELQCIILLLFCISCYMFSPIDYIGLLLLILIECHCLIDLGFLYYHFSHVISLKLLRHWNWPLELALSLILSCKLEEICVYEGVCVYVCVCFSLMNQWSNCIEGESNAAEL